MSEDRAVRAINDLRERLADVCDIYDTHMLTILENQRVALLDLKQTCWDESLAEVERRITATDKAIAELKGEQSDEG